jgi:hypothetical protein
MNYARLVFALVGMYALACKVEPGNPGPDFTVHCADKLGNETCAAEYPDRPFCSLCEPKAESMGCVATRPAAPVCRPDPTPSTSGDTLAADSSSSSSDGSSGSTTMADGSSSSSSSSTGAACSGDGDCAALEVGTPYCIAGFCSSCVAAGGNEFCGELEATTPACDEETGACMGCQDATTPVCAGQLPVCATTGACVPCSRHDECSSGACHLAQSDPFFGECFAESERVWVDNDQICPGQGTAAVPNCSLAQAIGSLADGANRVIIFQSATVARAEDITLAANANVAVIGQGGPLVIGTVANGGAGETAFVVDAGTLYLQGVRIVDNDDSHGMRCSDATIWMQQAEVRGNARTGLFGSGPCDVVIENSVLHHNEDGAVRMLGGTLRIDNSVIGENGAIGGAAGLTVQLAKVDVLYSTIAGNVAAGADSLQCFNATGSVRNSIVSGAAANSVDLDCFTLSFERNAVDTAGFVDSDGAMVGAYDSDWFVNAAGGDFRLTSPESTPFGGIAQWQTGDPELDADGTARPTTEPGYVGADEP